MSYELCDKVQEIFVELADRYGNIKICSFKFHNWKLASSKSSRFISYCFGKPRYQLVGIGTIGGSGVNSEE